MKTQTIEWNSPVNNAHSDRPNPVVRLNSATRVVTRLVQALVPALAMIVSAAWLVTLPDMVIYLQAALWASGLVFFGLALVSEKAAIGLSLATGFALPLLAWLSSRVAVEISIFAVALVAAWIATAIWVTSAKSPTNGQY